jgi:hypothetical protein
MIWTEWLELQGEPEQVRFEILYSWDEGRLVASPYNGRVGRIALTSERPSGLTRSEARMVALSYGPRDARLVRDGVSPSGDLFELYMSEQLRVAYPDGPYGNSPPGTFTVTFSSAPASNLFAGVSISTGGAP